MQAAERRYLQQADHVLTVSEDDRRHFAEFVDAAKLSVIPTGADTEFFSPAETPETPNRLVFTGSMDWLPNEDGVVYFIKEILPLIRQEAPDLFSTVVGRNPSQRLKDLAARTANVHLTGWVEDIRPFLSQAAVVRGSLEDWRRHAAEDFRGHEHGQRPSFPRQLGRRAFRCVPTSIC